MAAGRAPDWGAPVPADIEDFVAATPAVAFALWEFVLGLDLLGRVKAWQRPVDEPLQAAVVDARTVTVHAVEDDLWVRVVDVPAALAARSYRDGEPAVVEVVDAFRPANSGNYRITPDGAERCDAEAGVSLDVDALAAPYLGAWSWSALAAAGRVRVADPAALAALDELFRVDAAPYTGTPF
ncbi:sterol carrier protein domain-containing protein [Actinokineospora soli]|uniref:Sterol carrier protein domain-containing protein n=1 Tax=Actinokineospora soli TaxID=1048753 RepID=A0ABW2TPZ0_9PSEU